MGCRWEKMKEKNLADPKESMMVPLMVKVPAVTSEATFILLKVGSGVAVDPILEATLFEP